MAKNPILRSNWLQSTAVRVTRAHFLYIFAYMVSIVVFDSWNLFTHANVSSRWTAAVTLLVANTVIWYFARQKFGSSNSYTFLILSLIIADIIFASFNVYWERGIASKALALYTVPLVSAAALRSRSVLLATTILSSAAYSLAAVRYFYLHYGESFRIELYGDLAFYCATFFVLAWLLWVVVDPIKEKF
jgi:hypothetical protein